MRTTNFDNGAASAALFFYARASICAAAHIIPPEVISIKVKPTIEIQCSDPAAFESLLFNVLCEKLHIQPERGTPIDHAS